MARQTAMLVAILALTGLSGCRAFERLTKDKDKPAAEPASRTKDRDRDPGGPPKDWLSGPAPQGRGDRVPPADGWADPASRGSGRTLSGVILDADGRPIPNAYVTVENADPIKAGFGAPMGVESDRDGLFEINGLNSSERYMLSASISRGGKAQAGRISVQVPNNRIKLRLQEDFQLPVGRGREDLPPLPGSPPSRPADAPPSAAPPDTHPDNHQWSPLGPGGKKDDAAPASRGDLTAPGPQPDWRSALPPANIPGPGAAPSVPSPTAPNIPPLVPGPTSKTTSRESQVTVLGSDGRPRDLLSGRAEDLVLLDFMTTTCVPCKKAIPALAAFSAKQGRSVEVVGVICDQGSDNRRVELANAYRREQRIPYTVAAESSRYFLQDQFGVEAYPTLVLLDGTGRRLWKGHPKNLDEVERILRNR